MTIKLAIIYYSSTGTNHKMAEKAAHVARTWGAEVRLSRVAELAPEQVIASNPAWQAHLTETQEIPVAKTEDLDWADAIIFSTPTRFGNVAAQLKQFIDQTGGLWAKGKLANKVVSAFTSAQNPHGGQEATLLALYTTFYHWGSIVVAPGYTAPEIFKAGGNPYGASTAVDEHGVFDHSVFDAIEVQTRRVLDIAAKLKD
ncbi:NAD(P)H:quinone oxidoreductase [Cohnella sp. 56]|uniref:NAD(P)H:quinone oxidoreductase n=1 Tax=Cohnella sp. 56 TaxID=3113722 RepID=UPI0030E75A83